MAGPGDNSQGDQAAVQSNPLSIPEDGSDMWLRNAYTQSEHAYFITRK